MDNVTFHEITSLDDPCYDAFLDIYQMSFPLNEQALVSAHNRDVRARGRGEPTIERHMAALVGEAVEGIAQWALPEEEGGAAALWYLAVREGRRGGGLGAALYAEVVRRVRAEAPDAPALAWEVERPDRAESPEQAVLAERRIRFYQRQGGLLLGGIHYTQSTGWQPPVEMHLMLHPFRGMDAEEAFRLCSSLFGAEVRRIAGASLVLE